MAYFHSLQFALMHDGLPNHIHSGFLVTDPARAAGDFLKPWVRPNGSRDLPSTGCVSYQRPAVHEHTHGLIGIAPRPDVWDALEGTCGHHICAEPPSALTDELELIFLGILGGHEPLLPELVEIHTLITHVSGDDVPRSCRFDVGVFGMAFHGGVC